MGGIARDSVRFGPKLMQKRLSMQFSARINPVAAIWWVEKPSQKAHIARALRLVGWQL